MSQQIEDHTRVIPSADQDWITLPNVTGANIKVIVADEELKQVIFKFKFDPGTELPPHTHKCHAIAYTISGEWEYEGLKLPEGAIAYEPVESVHTPSSEHGAELVVFLKSQDDQFLINHMPDGSDFTMDMEFFKTIEGITAEEASKLEIPGLTD